MKTNFSKMNFVQLHKAWQSIGEHEQWTESNFQRAYKILSAIARRSRQDVTDATEANKFVEYMMEQWSEITGETIILDLKLNWNILKFLPGNKAYKEMERMEIMTKYAHLLDGALTYS